VKREDVQSLMREVLDARVLEVLEACGQVGDSKDTHTYIVGGLVRDILLRRPGFDIDVVVEGDGMEYSRVLAERLQGEFKTYDAFGTATVNSEDGIRVDVASARREVYEEPAALPKVAVGNLKDDMFRRDFTINSMAISVNGSVFGQLVDFFSGEVDLSKGVIRVLHDKSFEDDPTRILRAVRFETRFGFKIDSKTEQLLADAIARKMLEKLSPERKRYEMELLLGEEKPEASLDRMRQLKVFKHLAPGLKAPDMRHARSISSSIEEVGRRLKVKPWLVYLISIADTLPFSEAVSFGKSLSLKKGEVERIIQVKMVKPEVAGLETEEDVRPSRVYRILKRLSPEGLVYIYSIQKKDVARKRLKEFIEKHRTRRTHITGEDIKRLGISEGPIYRKILDEVLDAKIDGEIESYEDEMNLARKIVEVS
jgi:tRNA nucleotidyltransferase (CCA-adding enzyme)